MRNEALIGYLLHQRPYQEKRALYHLFSQQHGIINGVGKKGAPLFVPLQLFATGKRDLKTFSQMNIVPLERDFVSAETQRYQQISGQQQYAALYLNEILLKLLPTEDPMPVLWQYYQDSLRQLKQPLTAEELRLCLRQFEQRLFTELGFALTLAHDNTLSVIEPDCTYQFLPDVGLVPIVQTDHLANTTVQAVFEGSEILLMAQLGISATTLSAWSRLHRQLIDHLLDYQPLQSRLLWQQQQRYQ
ncbi:DNA repair protein RecO (recombination protein O) [Psychrobacter sp. PL15]|uniref:DNA repair protein RecO n=1 Tax=unclassified Psychrobacter TaxID=196806 RepID=UPI001AE0F0D3|nr:DNA repair protein RecO C-terminal domain-containing protein [Psychrobacter sp. PL15]MEC5209916.1 DNA repair protein RecO (recombination protein O) [Psychrobacter sp. PL15]